MNDLCGGARQADARAAALAAAGKPGEERAAAERVIAANCNCNIVIASLEAGTYRPDAAIPAEQRFNAGGATPNAVRIVLTRDRPMFFGSFLTGRQSTVIGASATGARRGYAAFSLGSRVAAVHGGIPNALLSALTGSQVNLSVMDYNALASADIDLLAFSDALRTELDADVLTFGQTLNTQATLPQVLSALLETEAGFQGSQMTAMDNATRNAGDMIKSLQLRYNRARQAQITKELIEIISGAEAL